MLKCGAQDDRPDQPETPAVRPGDRHPPGTLGPHPSNALGWGPFVASTSPPLQDQSLQTFIDAATLPAVYKLGGNYRAQR